MSRSACVAGPVIRAGPRQSFFTLQRNTVRTLKLKAEDPKFQGEVLREFNEGDGTTKEVKQQPTGTFYNDEYPEPPRQKLSPEYQKRLRDEYLALGGSPDTAMGGNYFLYIIVIIAVLAVLSKLTGAI
eukprot:jgi/Botrbrau1/21059/Bobra.0144s0058.1